MLIMATKWFTPVFLAICTYILMDFARPVKKWKAFWCLAGSLIMTVNGLLMLTAEFQQLYPKVWLLTVTLPFIVITVAASDNRDMRIVFIFITVLLFGCIDAGCGIVASLMSDLVWMDPVCRFAAGLPCLVLIVHYRETYLSMLQFLNKGWAGIALPPALLCLAFFIFSNLFDQISESIVWLLYVLLALLSFGFYYIIYLFFRKVLSEQLARQNQHLLSLQAKALRTQQQDYLETEQQTMILRHDVKHYQNLLKTYLAGGQPEEALKILDEAKEKLEKDFDYREDGI